MFYKLDTHRDLKTGATVTYNGFQMKLTRLERIPGGVSATLEGIPGTEYPHPIYSHGFTAAADNVKAVA